MEKGCAIRALACEGPIYYGTTSMIRDRSRLAWAENTQARSMCLDSADNFEYGAYKWTVPLVTTNSRLEKILFPIFWGLMTLRSQLLSLTTNSEAASFKKVITLMFAGIRLRVI